MFEDQVDKWKKKDREVQEAKYCSKVRMGNWNEELILQEAKLKYFLRKKEKGELLVQRTRKTFENLLKEVTLRLPGDFLCFGDPCQLAAPAPLVPRAPCGLTLACVVGGSQVDSCQHLAPGCLLAASTGTTPCVRNCFRITSPDGRCRGGERLKYGESFALAAWESPCEMPLFVESEVPHLHSILGLSKHPLLRLTTYRNIYSMWRVQPLDHATREDLQDTPVPANVAVVISHVASNKNLALEPASWFSTYFGPECEVSVHTELDVYRRETANNVWVIVTNRPHDS